jgi:uncharacterized protein
MESPRIIEGRRYPVKSCLPEIYSVGGTFEIGMDGPVGDREFMVVDEASGELRTQRRKMHKGYSDLAKVQPQLSDETLILNAPGMQELSIDINQLFEEASAREVEIWGDKVGALISAEGSKWFSDYLHQHCQLVRKDARRLINREYASSNAEVTFADRNQIHVISQATIDGLNKILSECNISVSADNFRPNIVLGGLNDREENDYDFMHIGNVVLRSTIPCIRCEMPGNDPASGEFRKEILQVLGKHYKPHTDKSPIVGEQFEVAMPGFVTIGQPVDFAGMRVDGWRRKF